MHMKRESIADKGVWTGKKHYVMHVHNEEGVAYSTPKMKMVGIEAVRSSTPKVCRESIKKALTILMTGGKEPLLEFIKEFRTKWNEMSFEEVAFPRGVKLTYFRNIDGRNVPMKYSIDNKSLPIQVRASLVYNQMIAVKNLTNKYKLISDEEKIKFCYLKKPNPCHHNVIASPGDLPTEFGLNEYIDYDLQFDKAFLDPIKSITDVLGWNLDGEVSTLEGFFS
jgi:DNA polymerase elongation subunit (family B)